MACWAAGQKTNSERNAQIAECKGSCLHVQGLLEGIPAGDSMGKCPEASIAVGMRCTCGALAGHAFILLPGALRLLRRVGREL